MIQEVKMFACSCDNCGEMWGDDIMAYTDITGITENVLNSDWYRSDDGKYYCPKCYDIDDNDVLRLSEERHKETKSPEVNKTIDHLPDAGKISDDDISNWAMLNYENSPYDIKIRIYAVKFAKEGARAMRDGKIKSSKNK